MHIPEQIAPDELLIRNIFYPFGYKKGKLQANAFQPPYNSNEIKAHIKIRGKTIKNIVSKLPEGQQNIFSESLAQDFENIEKLNSSINELIDADKQVIMTGYISIPDLPMHADILYPELRERDVPLPVSISKPMKELVRDARYYNDPAPDSKIWYGEIIT
jgi:hypothetical protein